MGIKKTLVINGLIKNEPGKETYKTFPQIFFFSKFFQSPFLVINVHRLKISPPRHRTWKNIFFFFLIASIPQNSFFSYLIPATKKNKKAQIANKKKIFIGANALFKNYR